MRIIVCLLILFLTFVKASLAGPLVGDLEIAEKEILFLSPGSELSFVSPFGFFEKKAAITIFGSIIGEGNPNAPIVIIPENLYFVGNPHQEKIIVPYRMDLKNVEDELSLYRRLYLLGQISHGLFLGYKYHGWFK